MIQRVQVFFRFDEGPSIYYVSERLGGWFFLTFSYVFAGVDRVRFRRRVGPGDDIHLYSKILNEKRGIWKFECKAEVDNERVCSATILCADRAK